MRVFFIDPGKASGWFCIDFTTFDWMGGERQHDAFLDWLGGKGNLQLELSPLADWALDRVVIEGFDITEETSRMVKASDPLWSIEQIGCVRTWCRWLGIPFEVQSRTAKAFDADGEKMKKLGWWHPPEKGLGEEGHRRDAGRHALKWGVDHRLIPLEALL